MENLDYQPFGELWEKELAKWRKEDLAKYYDIPVQGKRRMIQQIRTKLIIEDFNRKFPVGSSIWWRCDAMPDTPYKKYWVHSPATNMEGTPVAKLQGKHSYVSIEPQFFGGGAATTQH